MKYFVNVNPEHETTSQKWRIGTESGTFYFVREVIIDVPCRSEIWNGALCLLAIGNLIINSDLRATILVE